MIPVKHKALAYITHGKQLLVFRHVDFPEAGIQVPGGTVAPGEDFAAAALREAEEESGLADLVVVACLGEQVRDMADTGKPEIHHRHFYHLHCGGAPPERWRHAETDPSDGGPAPIRFEFFWVELLEQAPELICDQGILLPRLVKVLSNE